MNVTKYSFLSSKTFWSTAVLVVYNFVTAIVPVFPNIGWLSTLVNLLGLVLITVFHVSGVNAAAVASAQATASSAAAPTVPKPVSGQQ
jgi:hypothetical protein